jgi:hypothetical protein
MRPREGNLDALLSDGLADRMLRSLMTAAVVLVAPCAIAEEKDDVVAAFKGYKEAILAQKGEEAAGWVTKGTIDEYQRYVDWALEADRKTVEGLSMINRVQVLTMRHRVPAEQLRKATGKSIFIHAVKEDWIGKDGVIRTELGDEITVAGEKATVPVLIGGEPAPLKFQFRKEEGKWRFDLVELMAATGPAFEAAAKQAGMEENELILKVLEKVSGKKPEDSIWTPVGKGE